MIPVWLTDTVTTDLGRAINYTNLWGLEGWVLRTVGGIGDRVPFVNEEKLSRRVWENEMTITAIMPGVFEGPVSDKLEWMNEVVAFDEIVQFCKRMNCPTIIISAFSACDESNFDIAVDAIKQLAKIAVKRQINLAVLNESSMAFGTGSAISDLVKAVNHEAVGIAWSPTECESAGEDANEGITAAAEFVKLVRCDDRSFATDDVVSTDIASDDADDNKSEIDNVSIIDWEHQLNVLATTNFDGPLSLEVNQAPAKKHGLRTATKLIHLIRNAKK